MNNTDNHMDSILPSYYMYANTINTGINESELDPPEYNFGPCLTSASTIDDSIATDHIVDLINAEVLPSPNDGIKETLLDNIHQVKKITSEIRISIKFTKEPNSSLEIDSSSIEYHQGDHIHGYVLLNNLSSAPIPFEKFTLTLEGEFRKASPFNSTVKVNKFLNMYELIGSFNLVSDGLNYAADTETVPFTNDKLVHPNITYKRFFSFKLPLRLLDSSCSSELECHKNLPPSMGDVKDFATINSSIKYGVWARFIGKKSKYELVLRDEFVVVKEQVHPFRVVPLHEATCSSNSYKLFIRSINDSIDYGKRLLTRSKNEVAVKTNEIRKISNEGPASPIQSMVIPILRMSRFLESVSGSLTVTYNTEPFVVSYVPPMKYNSPKVSHIPNELNIPLELILNNASKTDLKSVTSELCIITIESLQHQIPFEITHDIILNPNDTVKNNLIIPMKRLKKELFELSAQLDGTDWSVDKELVIGLKSMSDLSVKSVNLPIKKTTMRNNAWSEGKKDINVCVNLSTAISKSEEDFTLVPSFQICSLVRLYYVQINLIMTTGQILNLRVPLKIQL